MCVQNSLQSAILRNDHLLHHKGCNDSLIRLTLGHDRHNIVTVVKTVYFSAIQAVA